MKTSALLPANSSRGFTLLELMVAVTVLAILAGIGIPSFSNLMRSNQIAADANNLVAALTLARSESMKRGVRVSVCPTQDASECTGDWRHGWMVFEDDFGTAGVFDPSDVSIQIWSAPGTGVTVAADANSVVFTPSAALNGASRTFSVTKAGCTADQRRQIGVATSGRISLTRVNCTTAPPVEEPEEESES